MRVDDHNRAGSAAWQSGKASEAQRAERLEWAEGSGPAGAAGGDGDRWNLSGAAGRIRQALESLAEDHAGRVERLAVQVRSGRYQVNARELSRAMLAESLGPAGS